MPGTIFGIPFDEELFLQMWGEAPDPVKTALLDSGVMVNDAAIASMIQSSGNLYTIPFFNVLSGVRRDGRLAISPQNCPAQILWVILQIASAAIGRNIVNL